MTACQTITGDLRADVVNVMELDAERHEGERPRDVKVRRTEETGVPHGMAFLVGHPIGRVALVLQVEELHSDHPPDVQGHHIEPRGLDCACSRPVGNKTEIVFKPPINPP